MTDRTVTQTTHADIDLVARQMQGWRRDHIGERKGRLNPERDPNFLRIDDDKREIWRIGSEPVDGVCPSTNGGYVSRTEWLNLHNQRWSAVWWRAGKTFEESAATRADGMDTVEQALT